MCKKSQIPYSIWLTADSTKNRSMQNSNKMTLPNYNKVLKKKVYSLLATLITYNKTSLKD